MRESLVSKSADGAGAVMGEAEMRLLARATKPKLMKRILDR